MHIGCNIHSISDTSISGGIILTSQIFAGGLCTYEPEWVSLSRNSKYR